MKSKTALKIAQIPQNFKIIIAGENEAGLLSPEKRFNEEKGLITFSIPPDFEYKYLFLLFFEKS